MLWINLSITIYLFFSLYFSLYFSLPRFLSLPLSFSYSLCPCHSMSPSPSLVLWFSLPPFPSLPVSLSWLYASASLLLFNMGRMLQNVPEAECWAKVERCCLVGSTADPHSTLSLCVSRCPQIQTVLHVLCPIAFEEELVGNSLVRREIQMSYFENIKIQLDGRVHRERLFWQRVLHVLSN